MFDPRGDRYAPLELAQEILMETCSRLKTEPDSRELIAAAWSPAAA